MDGRPFKIKVYFIRHPVYVKYFQWTRNLLEIRIDNTFGLGLVGRLIIPGEPFIHPFQREKRRTIP
jgi:hypothetical protein